MSSSNSPSQSPDVEHQDPQEFRIVWGYLFNDQFDQLHPEKQEWITLDPTNLLVNFDPAHAQASKNLTPFKLLLNGSGPTPLEENIASTLIPPTILHMDNFLSWSCLDTNLNLPLPNEKPLLRFPSEPFHVAARKSWQEMMQLQKMILSKEFKMTCKGGKPEIHLVLWDSAVKMVHVKATNQVFHDWEFFGRMMVEVVITPNRMLRRSNCLSHPDQMVHGINFRMGVWNVRGVLHPDFKRLLTEFISREQVQLLILTETRLDGERAKEIVASLPLSNLECTNTIGYVGGIWLLWNQQDVDVEVVNKSEQEIHAIIKVSPSSPNWLLSGIYASPKLSNRKILWNNLKNITDNHSMPWLVVGDFNEVISQSEKLGGAPINLHRVNLFTSCLDQCNLSDLSYSGPSFTWTNSRSFSQLIMDMTSLGWIAL